MSITINPAGRQTYTGSPSFGVTYIRFIPPITGEAGNAIEKKISRDIQRVEKALTVLGAPHNANERTVAHVGELRFTPDHTPEVSAFKRLDEMQALTEQELLELSGNLGREDILIKSPQVTGDKALDNFLHTSLSFVFETNNQQYAEKKFGKFGRTSARRAGESLTASLKRFLEEEGTPEVRKAEEELNKVFKRDVIAGANDLGKEKKDKLISYLTERLSVARAEEGKAKAEMAENLDKAKINSQRARKLKKRAGRNPFSIFSYDSRRQGLISDSQERARNMKKAAEDNAIAALKARRLQIQLEEILQEITK